jgi:glutamate synthase (NADPH/NADH) large chain
VNPETVLQHRIEVAHWEGVLRDLVEQHIKATGSKWAMSLLADWERQIGHFWQVVPREMVGRLAFPTQVAQISAAE